MEEKASVTKRDSAQNMDIEDKDDGTRHHAKQFRPPLSIEILYGEDKWINWVQQPFNLPELIERRNKARNMYWIHVASISKEKGVSGFGYIIRDCHGTPIFAYSEYVTDETEPVSEFYLEMKAVDKSLEKAEKLNIKYVSVVTKSEEVSRTVTAWSLEQCIYRMTDQRVIAVSLGIREKVTRYCEPDFFPCLPGGKRSHSSAVCMAELAASERKSTLEFLFDEGPLPLGQDKLVDLLKLLHSEATSTLPFHP